MSNAKHPIDLLKPLSDEIIAQKGFELADIWVVKLGDDVKGPFHTKQIWQVAEKYPDYMPSLVVCNLNDETWQGFYQAKAFQRRQFSVSKDSQPSENKPILIFKDGQKYGPIQIPELEKEIENGKFLRSDLLSSDKGRTWIKIYEHPHFDRRSHQGERLPLSPQNNSFQVSKENTKNLLSIKSKFIQKENKGIDSLAKLTGDLTTTIIYSPEKEEVKPIKNILAYGAIAVTIFLCVFTLFDAKKTSTTSKVVKKTRKQPVKRTVSSKPVKRKVVKNVTRRQPVKAKRKIMRNRPVKRVVRKPRKARRVIKSTPHKEQVDEYDQTLDNELQDENERDLASNDYDEDEIEELKSELMEQLSDEDKEVDEYKEEFEDDEGRY